MVLNVWIYAYVQSTIYHIFSIDIDVHVKVIAFIFIWFDCRCSLLYIYSDSVVVKLKVGYLSLIAQPIWPTSSNIFNHVLQINYFDSTCNKFLCVVSLGESNDCIIPVHQTVDLYLAQLINIKITSNVNVR